MKIYRIDARDAFVQEDNPNLQNGIIYSATKKTAISTAKKIAKEVKLHTKNPAANDIFSHEWAKAGSGTVSVYCVTAKDLRIRTLAEALLNNGEWIEEEELVFERSF